MHHGHCHNSHSHSMNKPGRFHKLGWMICLLACSMAAYAQDIVKLSGSISSRESDTLQISYNDSHLAWYPKQFYAPLNKNGHFSIAFPVPHGVYIQAEIKHGNHVTDLVLHGGDSLVMTANAAHFDSTIHLTGRGAAVQNFVLAHTLRYGRMNQYTSRMKNAVTSEPKEFLKATEGELKKEADYLDKYKASLPKGFVKYWNGFYQYYTWFFTEQYAQMHEMYKKRHYTDTIPQENYVVIRDLPLAFDDDMLQVPSYLLYLTGIYDTKLRAAGLNYPSADTAGLRAELDSVLTLVYQHMPPGSAEFFVAQDIYTRARYQPIQRTEKVYASFKQRWPSSQYMPLLEQQVGVTRRLAPGQPAPDFNIHTQDGVTVKLSDLKGKAVYLSFWGTNCRQCIGEIIAEKKVKEPLGNKPVAFVYVQLDDDTASARTIRERYKISGLFTHAEGSWASTEAQLYGVTGMPAYYLIDTEGRIAVQNAPPPMRSVELIVAISKLLP
jgi:peroxiredoxin